MNRVMLIGRLGSDPKSGVTTAGVVWANISLATSEHWKDKDGKKQESVEWHPVVFHDRLAEVVRDHLKKGAQVAVVGKIKTRKWQDTGGESHQSREIHASELEMLGSKPETSKPAEVDIPENDIPF